MRAKPIMCDWDIAESGLTSSNHENITSSIVDCNEDMSERPDQTLEEKMAIPERGGEDHMDVSYQEENDASEYGYVNIRSKGPGMPITIRGDEKPQIFSHGIEADSARPMSPREYDQIPDLQAELGSQFKDQSAEFLDKSTGQSVPCGIGSLKVSSPEDNNISDVTGNVDTRNCFQDELEVHKPSTDIEHKSSPDSEFRSQARVVSLSPENRPLQLYLSSSPAKTKYKLHQEGAKKKLGMKKGTSPGKESRSLQLVPRDRPYPNWLDVIVNINGKNHKAKVNPVPEDDMPVSFQTLEQEEIQQEGIEPALKENIHANGSKDRPPDESHCLENEFQPPDGLCMSRYQTAAGVTTAPCNYGNFSDKPLDLTIVKPLDLSMKRKSIVDTCQGQMSFTEKGNEMTHDLENAPANVTAKVQEYRSRCPSVVSMDDKDVPLEEDLMETGLASDVKQQYSEELNTSDGNLPSLGKLTLESNTSDQQQALTSQKSGIQDSSVKQAMAAAMKGKQNRPASANISPQEVQELLALIIQYQHKQSVIRQQNGPSSTCSISNADLPSQQTPAPAGLQNEKEMRQEIPTPPIPNLQSLELTDNEGGIVESNGERTKYKLKYKILQRIGN